MFRTTFWRYMFPGLVVAWAVSSPPIGAAQRRGLRLYQARNTECRSINFAQAARFHPSTSYGGS